MLRLVDGTQTARAPAVGVVDRAVVALDRSVDVLVICERVVGDLASVVLAVHVQQVRHSARVDRDLLGLTGRLARGVVARLVVDSVGAGRSHGPIATVLVVRVVERLAVVVRGDLEDLGLEVRDVGVDLDRVAGGVLGLGRTRIGVLAGREQHAVDDVDVAGDLARERGLDHRRLEGLRGVVVVRDIIVVGGLLHVTAQVEQDAPGEDREGGEQNVPLRGHHFCVPFSPFLRGASSRLHHAERQVSDVGQ